MYFECFRSFEILIGSFEILIGSNSNLKSHKFDNWYELYCGTKYTQKKNLVTIELEFDHGS
jgi:hypothetical protein